jgi:hypothetical protein
MGADGKPILAAMKRLTHAERERRAAIGELMALGVIRSRTLVGDLGEALAAAFYGVPLPPPSNPGFDVTRHDGLRVQVRALRCTPENFRTSIGVMREPHDVLFAIRLDEDYAPLEAIEAPREAVERFFGRGRVTWTKGFASDLRVRHIPATELLRYAATTTARSRRGERERGPGETAARRSRSRSSAAES